MISGIVPLDSCRTKFYQRERDSKRFLDLSEEDLVLLSKKVYRKEEIMEDTLLGRVKKMSNLERYQKTLQYLTSPLIGLEFKTFDERIAFLIMMVDPNLITFKEFLKLDLISLEEIDKIDDKKEKSRLSYIRMQTISDYENSVREKIGFYDVKLLKHEEKYFKRFFGEKELITEVNSHNQDSFIKHSKLLKDFNCISDERYLELVNIAQTWLSFAPDKFNSSVATYSITNQRNLLGLNNLAEQLTLFILIVDSNLDMLRIYEEECMIKNTERRTIEEFGYFNMDLIALEKKYHERFCPNKQVSIWSKVKKD